ncbi:Protein of unknown function [Bacillus mycoides]|nr:Protein of unknown function [Bacillus mycoides]
MVIRTQHENLARKGIDENKGSGAKKKYKKVGTESFNFR